MPNTKIEFNSNKIARIQGLDELAQLLFPGNRSHQRVFLAIFIELKYAPDQFLPCLISLCDRHGFSPRMIETVRSKLRRPGIIDLVSRFNKSYGYKEGRVFSNVRVQPRGPLRRLEATGWVLTPPSVYS